MAKSIRQKAKRRRSQPKLEEISLHGYIYQQERDRSFMVDGHRLTADQFDLFRSKVNERMEIAERQSAHPIKNKNAYARRVGLADFLWLHRPGPKAQDQLNQLGMDLSDVALSICSMKEFSWYKEDAASRLPACEMMRKLADTAEARVKRLRHYIDTLAQENSTGVQDWIRREAELDALSREGVSAA